MWLLFLNNELRGLVQAGGKPASAPPNERSDYIGDMSRAKRVVAFRPATPHVASIPGTSFQEVHTWGMDNINSVTFARPHFICLLQIDTGHNYATKRL